MKYFCWASCNKEIDELREQNSLLREGNIKNLGLLNKYAQLIQSYEDDLDLARKKQCNLELEVKELESKSLIQSENSLLDLLKPMTIGGKIPEIGMKELFTQEAQALAKQKDHEEYKARPLKSGQDKKREKLWPIRHNKKYQ